MEHPQRCEDRREDGEEHEQYGLGVREDHRAPLLGILDAGNGTATGRRQPGMYARACQSRPGRRIAILAGYADGVGGDGIG